MEYLNTQSYVAIGLEKIEFPEGDVVGRHYKLDVKQIARIHQATFVDESGTDIHGLWLVPVALTRDPMVVKSIKHPIEQSEEYTNGMDMNAVSNIDSLQVVAGTLQEPVFPQVHAIQIAMNDDVSALTTYFILGLVVIGEPDTLAQVIDHIVSEANLVTVEAGTETMWMTETERSHFEEHGVFEQDPTHELNKHLMEHGLIDLIPSNSDSELGSDTER